MQISSSTHTLRIPTAQLSALDSPGSPLEVSGRSAASLDINTALQSSDSHRRLQESLAANAVNTEDRRGKSSQVTNVLDYLTRSDIELIEKATGSTYENGFLVGGHTDSGPLQIALSALRQWGRTSLGEGLNPITGDITAHDLRASRMSGVLNFEAIKNALSILESKNSA